MYLHSYIVYCDKPNAIPILRWSLQLFWIAMLFTHRVRVRDPFKIHAIYLLVDVYSIPSGKRLHITMENHPLHSWVSINIEHVGIYIKLIVNIAIDKTTSDSGRPEIPCRSQLLSLQLRLRSGLLDLEPDRLVGEKTTPRTTDWNPKDHQKPSKSMGLSAIGGFSPSYDNFKIQCCGPSSMKNTPGFVWQHATSSPKFRANLSFPTGWYPPVISWFINLTNYSYL